MSNNRADKVAHILSDKRTHTLALISRQYSMTQKATYELAYFDIPYFAHIKASFFDGKKLLLSTDIPELLAKFRELDKPLKKLLRTRHLFRELESVKLYLHFETQNHKAKKTNTMSQTAKRCFEKLAASSKQPTVTDAVNRLIKKE